MTGKLQASRDLAEFRAMSIPGRGWRRLRAMPALVLAAITAFAALASGTATAATPAAAGHITSFSAGIFSKPDGIVAGPDGALWFTNFGGNSIGRITTTGNVMSTRLDASISHPTGIAAGPDGALWFTDSGEQLHRPDHHRGKGDQLYRCGHFEAAGDHRGAGRGAVVHQLTATTPSAGSPPPGR